MAIAAPDQRIACMPVGGTGLVDTITDGRTLKLSDGRLVRLAALGVPTAPVNGDVEPPTARASRQALTRLTLGRQVSLRGTVEQDRYGRSVAEIERDDGMWIEGEMLRLGEAWFEPSARHLDLAPTMLRLEQDARDAGLGLWRTRFHGIRDVADFVHTDDQFTILEGKIAQIRVERGDTILSFSQGDLVLKADHAALRRFTNAGIALDGLNGARIRVRGWPYWAGHPALDLTYPEAVEVLEPRPPTKPEVPVCGKATPQP